MAKKVSLKSQNSKTRKVSKNKSERTSSNQSEITKLGYWKFSYEVVRVLLQRKRLWLAAISAYGVMLVLLGGITNQDMYRGIGTLMRASFGGYFDGTGGSITEASLLALSAFTGAATVANGMQQTYIGLLTILTWLMIVWLLRGQLAGHNVSIRDGLYASAGPLIPTAIIVLVGILQLLPLGVLALVYSSLAGVGLLSSPLATVLIWVLAVGAFAATLYWLTSTIIAFATVTVPGMYPVRALKIANQLVRGKRLQTLLRLLWLVMLFMLTWILLVVPVVMLDAWLAGLWAGMVYVPLVPCVIAIVSAISFVYASAYVYVLYRKLVDGS